MCLGVVAANSALSRSSEAAYPRRQAALQQLAELLASASSSLIRTPLPQKIGATTTAKRFCRAGADRRQCQERECQQQRALEPQAADCDLPVSAERLGGLHEHGAKPREPARARLRHSVGGRSCQRTSTSFFHLVTHARRPVGQVDTGWHVHNWQVWQPAPEGSSIGFAMHNDEITLS